MVAFCIVYKQAGHDLDLSRKYDMSILMLYLDRSRSTFARDTPVPEPSTIEGKGFVVVLLILYGHLPYKISRGVPGADDVSFNHGCDTRCCFATITVAVVFLLAVPLYSVPSLADSQACLIR